MKRSRFSEEQIVGVLQSALGQVGESNGVGGAVLTAGATIRNAESRRSWRIDGSLCGV